MAMTLVQTVTVGAGSPINIEFTNIPQTGKDLLIKFSLRCSSTTANFDFYKNGSGGSSGSRVLRGNGSTASSSTGASPLINNSTETANTFTNTEFYIPNYTQAINHSYSMDSVTENNATAANQEILAGRFGFNSAAATSIKIDVGGGFAQHSTASLYIIS